MTSGTTVRAPAAEEERRDRHALGVFPGRVDHRALARGRGEARVGCAALRPQPGRPGAAQPVDECSGGGAAVMSSHHTSPSGVRAHVGEDGVLGSGCSMALGLDSIEVPGATPKKPASGLMAYSRPSGPNFIQAMSSPTHWTFQPGRVGFIMARLVLPQALGKAAAM